LWIWPVLDPYHGSLLLLRPKVKLLFFAIDVEADFSGSNINLHHRSAQERSPKDEKRFFCGFHIEHHEVDRDEVTPDFHWDIFSDPYRIADRRIGQLELHQHWC
jgi:hypothetical protein